MNKIKQILLIGACSLTLLGASSAADAYACRWVPGHYMNGYFVPGHRVCWGGGGGYYHRWGYRHCWWRHGYRVCN